MVETLISMHPALAPTASIAIACLVTVFSDISFRMLCFRDFLHNLIEAGLGAQVP